MINLLLMNTDQKHKLTSMPDHLFKFWITGEINNGVKLIKKNITK